MRMINAAKMGIAIAMTSGIRKGFKVGRHHYRWAHKTRW